MPYKLRKAPKLNLYWVVAQDGTKKSKNPMPKDQAEAQMRALYADMHDKGELRGGAGTKKRLNSLLNKFVERWVDRHPQTEYAQFYRTTFMTRDDWDTFQDIKLGVEDALAAIGRTNINRSLGILRPIERDQTKVAQKHAILERLAIALESLLYTANASAIKAESLYSINKYDGRILVGPIRNPFYAINTPPQIPPLFTLDYILEGDEPTAATVAEAVLPPPPPMVTIQNPMHTAPHRRPPQPRKSPSANQPNQSHQQMIQALYTALGNTLQTPRQIVHKTEDGNLPVDPITFDEINTDDIMCDIRSGGEWQSKHNIYYSIDSINDLFTRGIFEDITNRAPITAVSPYRASIIEHTGSGKLVGGGHRDQIEQIYQSYLHKWKNEHPYGRLEAVYTNSMGVLDSWANYRDNIYPLPNEAIWKSMRKHYSESFEKLQKIGRSGKNLGILKPRSEQTERGKKKDKIVRDFKNFMDNKYNIANGLPPTDVGSWDLQFRVNHFFNGSNWPRGSRVKTIIVPYTPIQRRREENPPVPSLADPQRPQTAATEPQPLEDRHTRPKPPPSTTAPPSFSFWNPRPSQVHPAPPEDTETGFVTRLRLPTFNIPDDDDDEFFVGRGKKKKPNSKKS